MGGAPSAEAARRPQIRRGRNGPATGPAADDLTAFCREGLAAYKRPRHILVFDELPQTATGKLQRFRIRELAIERLGGAAAPDLTPLTGGS